MPKTYVRTEQISGSNTFNDSATVGSSMEATSGLRTLNDDLNNLRSIIKNLAGESNWYDDVTAVGGVQRNHAELHTHLDGLMSGSRPMAGVTLEGNLKQTGATFDVDTTGAVTVDSSTAGISLDAAAASNFTTSAGALTVEGAAGVTVTSTGGTLTMNGTGQTVDIDSALLDVDATGVQIDSTGGISIDSAGGNTNLTAAASLTMAATAGPVDIDADGGTLSLDGSAGINIGTESDVAIDMDASTLDIDTSGDVTINQSSGDGLWRVEGGGDISISSKYSGNEAYINFQEWGGVYVSGSFSTNVDGPRVLIGQTTAPKEFQVTGSSESDSLYAVQSFETLTLGVDATANSDNIQNLNFYGTGRAAEAKWTVTQFFTASLGASKMDIDGTDGVDITSGNGFVDIDADNGALSLDGSAGINIGTEADVAIDMDADTLDIDASGALTMTSTTMALDPSSTFDLDAAGAVTVDGASLAIGGDGDTGAITADSTAGISLDAAAASNFTTTAGALTLQGASSVSVSASGGDVTVEGTTFSGNDVTIPGNLTVSGNTTTLETTNATVKDSLIALGSSSSGIDTNADRGLLLPRTADVSKAFFWDHSESQFALVDTWSSGSDTAVVVDGYQDLRMKDLTANDISAAGLTASDLTDNRVVIAGTAGVLEDDANFTFDGSDLQLADNVGMVFSTDDAEKIESDGTDLTVNSGGDINLTATSDVNLPSSVGLTFGDDGEKIEGDGTDLTVSTSNDLNFSVTADFDVDAATVTVDASGAISLDAGAASNLSTSAGHLTLSAGTSGNVVMQASDGAIDIDADSGALSLDGSTGINIGTATDVAIDMDASTLDIDASSTINIDGSTIALGGAGSTGAITADSTAGISLDAAAASNLSTSAGALTLSGSGGLVLGGSSIGFHVDGSYDVADGLLLSSGSSDVDDFLSNFGEGNESIIGAMNYLYSLSSDTAVTKQVYVASGSIAADTPIEDISLVESSWNSDHVCVYLNGVLQRSGSLDLHDVYRDSSGNLKFNFALEDGDFIAVTSGSVGAVVSGGSGGSGTVSFVPESHTFSLANLLSGSGAPTNGTGGAFTAGVRFIPMRERTITGVRMWSDQTSDTAFKVSLWDHNDNRLRTKTETVLAGERFTEITFDSSYTILESDIGKEMYVSWYYTEGTQYPYSANSGYMPTAPFVADPHYIIQKADIYGSGDSVPDTDASQYYMIDPIFAKTSEST